MKNPKLYGFLSYAASALLLLGSSLYFYDLFWAVGQKTFFTFYPDYLSCFLPWNSEVNMYQGWPFSFFDLIWAFFGQFYRSWGIVIMPVVLGLLCALIFSWMVKRWLLRCRCGQYPEKLWQRFVWWPLPLLGALLFMWGQLSFAFSKQGFKDHRLKNYQYERVLLKTERLISEERYDEALLSANGYWFSHPCPIEDVITGQNTLYMGLSEAEITFRSDLAAFTRVALLGAHRLNEDFFTYFRVPEIYSQINLPATSAAGSAALIYKDLFTGNHTAAYSQMLCVFETDGLSASWLDLAVFSMLVCSQYPLADQYIRLLEGAPFYRRKARLYQEASRLLQAEVEVAESARSVAVTAAVGTQPVAPAKTTASAQVLAQKIKEERNKIPTGYILPNIFDEKNTHSLWQQSPHSLANLEQLCLFELLRKNTDSVLVHIDDYLRLTRQHKPPYRLPSSWQEILLIYRAENRPLPPKVLALLPYLKHDGFIARQNEAFYEARMRLYYGEITPYQITQNFGHTFAYNYYYSRFVDGVSGASKSLSH